MIRQFFILLSLIFALSTDALPSDKVLSDYCQEIKALKVCAQTSMIFDKKANPILGGIERDIITYKELSLLQRIYQLPEQLVLKWAGLWSLVLVTQKDMPKLFSYIETICSKAHIPIPAVYVTQSKWFLNAVAIKLFMTRGIIVIGQELLHVASNQELEAIVAHEIGHIKNNHSNKLVLLQIISNACVDRVAPHVGLKGLSLCVVKYFLPSFIINKRFEREADEFACKVAGKAEGLAAFFEYLELREKQSDEDFSLVFDNLQKNRTALSAFDYMRLMSCYYGARAGHALEKLIIYILGHTPLGAHPCHHERVETAKNFLAQQH